MLFDTQAAELEACELHEIKNVNLVHLEAESPYCVKKNDDGTTSLVRNTITAVLPASGRSRKTV